MKYYITQGYFRNIIYGMCNEHVLRQIVWQMGYMSELTPAEKLLILQDYHLAMLAIIAAIRNRFPEPLID